MIGEGIIKGAIDGKPENQYILAQKYYYGIGEDKDLDEAREWYGEAAKRGHVAASFMYAYLLLSGESGYVNVRRGIKYLKKACSKNYTNALLLMARNYFYGFGIKRSERKAFKLWQKGTKLGSAEAEYYLGLCYSKGIYVKTDIIKSKKHLLSAFHNGYHVAKVAIRDLKA